LKSGAVKLVFGLALLIGITLLMAWLSQMGRRPDGGIEDKRRQPEFSRMAEETRTGRKQMEELRRARADMRALRQRRHAAGLRPVAQNAPDPAQIEKRNSRRKASGSSAPALRNDIKYRFTVFAHKPAAAIHQLKNALSRAGIDAPEITEGRGLELPVPQKAYLKFVEDLQSLGRLKMERIRYRTEAPPDSPVPFEITIKKDTGEK